MYQATDFSISPNIAVEYVLRLSRRNTGMNTVMRYFTRYKADTATLKAPISPENRLKSNTFTTAYR